MPITLAPELLAAMEQHASLEIGNGVVYLAAYSWARANSFEGFSKRWRNDAQDEFAHAQNFVKFVARYHVAIAPTVVLAGGVSGVVSIQSLAELAAMLEAVTEESMRTLVATAEKTGDAAAVEWLSGKLLDQQKERKKADDFTARVRGLSPDGLTIMDRKIEKGGW